MYSFGRYFVRITPIYVLVLDTNSLPNEKFLDWTKLKAFAGEKINVPQIDVQVNVPQKLKFGLRRVEIIVEKGENASHQ